MLRVFTIFFAALLISLPMQAAPTVTIEGAVSNPQPVTGETITFDVVLRNNGPGAIRHVSVYADVEGALLLEQRGSLSAQLLNPGEELRYSRDVRIGNSVDKALALARITTYQYGNTRTLALREVRIEIPVRRAPSVSDLAVDMAAQPPTTEVGEPVIYTTTVSNFGPDPAVDIIVASHDPFGYAHLPADVEGAQCDAFAFYETRCRIGYLPAGGQTTIRYSRGLVTAPTQETRTVSVTAANSFDPNAGNSSLQRNILFGLSSEIARVLLPIVTPVALRGAHDSRWYSSVSVFLDSDEEAFVFPVLHECQITCVRPPLQGDFVPRRRRWHPLLASSARNPGYLLRVEAHRLDEMAFALRLVEANRTGTASVTVSLPVVTDEELITGRLQLIDIPAGQQFRQTLRVYHPDADGTRVRVRIYGETTPFVEEVLAELTLELAAEPREPQYNVGLPVHPGYAQLDVRSALSVDAAPQRLRVEIEPLSPDTRYWAFVSATDNRTQYVTIIAPEP